MQWTLPFFTQLIQWNTLLLFGSLLLFGLISGYLASKFPWIPRITGYLLIGFILGDSGFNLLSGDMLRIANIFADIAVALVVYQLGRYVDINWLKREKWLCATVVSSAILCFSFVSIALLWIGISLIPAVLSGVWAIATAPAVILVMLHDLNAEGQVTRRLATMTTLNNFIAIFATYILLLFIKYKSNISILILFQDNLYALFCSFLLAYIMYWLIIPLARLFGHKKEYQFVLVIAVITLIIGIAHTVHLPVMLTMLTFAILSKNLDRQYDLMELEFGTANELFIIILFMTIGASIHISDLNLIGFSVFILITARFIAMSCGVFLYARFTCINWKQAWLLTLGTLPMTEAGLNLIQTISHLYPYTMIDVVPLLTGCFITLELLGPIATQFSLIHSGETRQE